MKWVCWTNERMNIYEVREKRIRAQVLQNIALYIAVVVVAAVAAAAMAWSVSRIYRWTLRQYTSENVHVRVVINIALFTTVSMRFFSVFLAFFISFPSTIGSIQMVVHPMDNLLLEIKNRKIDFNGNSPKTKNQYGIQILLTTLFWPQKNKQTNNVLES